MAAPPPGIDGADARRIARELVDDLRNAAPSALAPRGLDLAPAVEQVLFFALRDGAAPRRRFAVPRLARGARAVASAVRPAPSVGPADVLVVLLAGVHARLFEPVAREVARVAPDLRVSTATASRASRDRSLHALPAVAAQPGWGDAAALVGAGIDQSRLRTATAGWGALIGERDAAMPRLAGDAVARLGIEAIRLDATVAAARPHLAVTYDEKDAWGRLLCAVGARHGVPVVDLPHAEAVDVEAIRGAAYDAMGVFGPRAARVLEAAGVAPERIAVIGAARFDGLVSAASHPVDPPPRVLLAAQYRSHAMTDALRRAVLEAASAAAAAIGGVVEIVPHPVETASSWEATVTAMPIGSPDLRVVGDAVLHERLPGAALLVTGWSNSVYEAVLAGVPAMTVHPGPGEPPMPFAREGIATGVRDAAEARRAAPDLAREPGRSAALARARPALAEHIGPLDGRATERTAQLILDAIRT